MAKFLYHGTSGKFAKAAMAEGLKPRAGRKTKGNWRHTVLSNPKAVYLTDAYPLYFALNAIDFDDRKDDEKLEAAVIQIDLSKLDTKFLVPDEDVMEQAGRTRDGIDGTMKERTRYYRQHMTDFIGGDVWQESLQHMGTCAYLGEIPREAISCVAFWDPRDTPTLSMDAMDAMVCLANYRFVGHKYKAMTNALFGEPLPPDPLLGGDLSIYFAVRLAARHEQLCKEISSGVRYERTMP